MFSLSSPSFSWDTGKTLSDLLRPLDSQLQKLDDFLVNPNPLADVIIELENEGKRIYTSRWLLASISETLQNSFLTKTDDDIHILKLPDVSLKAALEFMHWVMPSTQRAVTAGNAKLLLPLATKFHVDHLIKECEDALIVKFKTLSNGNARLEFLLLAQNQALKKLYDVCVDQMSDVSLDDLKSLDGFSDVAATTILDLVNSFAHRLHVIKDDVTLLVEDQQLTVSRCQLIHASPVFKAMLESDFKEGHSKEIVLPDKDFDDFEFLTDYITSGFMTPIEDYLLESILVLADEYLISRLKRDCEEFMISRIKCNCVQSRVSKTSDSDLLLQYLYLGQTYGLQKITTKAEKQLGGRRHTDLLELPNYHLPNLENVLRIRVKSLERQQKI